MQLFTNTARIISEMLKSTSRDGSPEGADLFLPMVIWVYLQISKTEDSATLFFNVEFIRLFRFKDLITPEDKYYLITFKSALEFIREMSYKDFNKTTIGEEEYKENIERAKRQIQLEDRAVEEANLLEMNPEVLKTPSKNGGSDTAGDLTKEQLLTENAFLKELLNEFTL